MSSGGMPYLPVNMLVERCAMANLRSRVKACAQLVLIDAAHHERRAVLARQRADQLEFFLTVFEIDGIDDALALAVSERQLHRLRVGGVDHDGRFDLANQLFVEGRDVGDLVAIARLQADIDDMRAIADLPARDLSRLFPLFGGDHVLEEAEPWVLLILVASY